MLGVRDRSEIWKIFWTLLNASCTKKANLRNNTTTFAAQGFTLSDDSSPALFPNPGHHHFGLTLIPSFTSPLLFNQKVLLFMGVSIRQETRWNNRFNGQWLGRRVVLMGTQNLAGGDIHRNLVSHREL